MATTEDTGSGGRVLDWTIVIDRAANGFIVQQEAPSGNRSDRHVFEDYIGLFEYLRGQFGEDIPHDRTVKTGLSEAFDK